MSLAKILILSNAHKGFLSSYEAGSLIKEGIVLKKPEWKTDVICIGDGGEGTLEAIVSFSQGMYEYIQAVNPLNESIETKIGIIPQTKTAVFEIIDLAGETQVNKSWNTLTTTSFGVGLVICKIAQMENVDNVIICLGGSIVSDGGAGMAQALGVEFYGQDGSKIVPMNKSCMSCIDLPRVHSIDISNTPSYIREKKYTILSDANIPLLGPSGQAATFGPQKKATPKDIKFIEQALTNWNTILEYTFNNNFNISLGGAAGGMGSALAAFVRGKILLGIDYILDLIAFNTFCRNYDWIITGEGKLDRTTTLGKCCYGIANRSNKLGKRYIGIFGRIVDLINEFEGCSIDASIFKLPQDHPPRYFSRQAIIEAASGFCDLV